MKCWINQGKHEHLEVSGLEVLQKESHLFLQPPDQTCPVIPAGGVPSGTGLVKALGYPFHGNVCFEGLFAGRKGWAVGLCQITFPSSCIHQYEIVLEGFKFSFFKWNSWLFLHGRIPCLQFTEGEAKELRTTKKSGVLFNTEQIFPFRFTSFKFYTGDSIHAFFLIDYEGFYQSTCYSPNISFFNFSFLSSICCGNLCGEREKLESDPCFH